MLKLTVSTNGTKVYCLSAGKSSPQFEAEAAAKNGKSLRYNEAYRKRLEVLHGFEYNTACTKLVISPDQQYIAAAGVYPPELKVFDTKDLGLKFVRRFDSEIQDFKFLSDDFRKLVILQNNRELQFHAPGGKHHSIRTPKTGRCLGYVSETATLYIGGSSSEIYKLNLEEGCFEAPLRSACEYINCCDVNPALPILATGGSDGVVECWNVREEESKPIASLEIPFDESDGYETSSVTCCKFSPNGLHLAVGCSEGDVIVYDIRSAKPLMRKSHKNRLPILSIDWVETSIARNSAEMHNDLDRLSLEEDDRHHEETIDFEAVVMSVDRKSVKFWCPATGGTLCGVESPTGINATGCDKATQDLRNRHMTRGTKSDDYTYDGVFNGAVLYPSSGLLLVPQELQRIGVYFIPAIGLAPRWISYLDSLTEELEDPNDIATGESVAKSTRQLYDDYEFVTKEQLQTLGVSQLIGTNLVRAYMHGYMIKAELHSQIKAVLQPFAFDDYQKEQKRKKLEEKRPMRIRVKPQRTVNAALAERLQSVVEETDEKQVIMEGALVTNKEKKNSQRANNLLEDSRFEKLFEDPDFEIEADEGKSVLMPDNCAPTSFQPKSDKNLLRKKGVYSKSGTSLKNTKRNKSAHHRHK